MEKVFARVSSSSPLSVAVARTSQSPFPLSASVKKTQQNILIMIKILNLVRNIIQNYTGKCPNCDDYYLDDEEICQTCGWPYNH